MNPNPDTVLATRPVPHDAKAAFAATMHQLTLAGTALSAPWTTQLKYDGAAGAMRNAAKLALATAEALEAGR